MTDAPPGSWIALADPAGNVLAWWGEAPSRIPAAPTTGALAVRWTATELELSHWRIAGTGPYTGIVCVGRASPGAVAGLRPRARTRPSPLRRGSRPPPLPACRVLLADAAGKPLVGARSTGVERPPGSKARGIALALVLLLALPLARVAAAVDRRGPCARVCRGRRLGQPGQPSRIALPVDPGARPAAPAVGTEASSRGRARAAAPVAVARGLCAARRRDCRGAARHGSGSRLGPRSGERGVLRTGGADGALRRRAGDRRCRRPAAVAARSDGPGDFRDGLRVRARPGPRLGLAPLPGLRGRGRRGRLRTVAAIDRRCVGAARAARAFPPHRGLGPAARAGRSPELRTRPRGGGVPDGIRHPPSGPPANVRGSGRRRSARRRPRGAFRSREGTPGPASRRGSVGPRLPSLARGRGAGSLVDADCLRGLRRLGPAAQPLLPDSRGRPGGVRRGGRGPDRAPPRGRRAAARRS